MILGLLYVVALISMCFYVEYCKAVRIKAEEAAAEEAVRVQAEEEAKVIEAEAQAAEEEASRIKAQ